MPTTISVEPSEQTEPSEQSPSCPDWDERDWEDYRSTTTIRAPLANLLDGLPGLDADEIAAMIRDLPMPNDVEVPGLTVEVVKCMFLCVCGGEGGPFGVRLDLVE